MERPLLHPSSWKESLSAVSSEHSVPFRAPVTLYELYLPLWEVKHRTCPTRRPVYVQSFPALFNEQGREHTTPPLVGLRPFATWCYVLSPWRVRGQLPRPGDKHRAERQRRLTRWIWLTPALEHKGGPGTRRLPKDWQGGRPSAPAPLRHSPTAPLAPGSPTAPGKPLMPGSPAKETG